MSDQERIIKGAAGATGGALVGGIFGAMSGAAGGAMQFGIPLGIIFGLISFATGNGFAGFVGALISTMFFSAILCGVIGGLCMPLGAESQALAGGKKINDHFKDFEDSYHLSSLDEFSYHAKCKCIWTIR